MQLFHFKQYTLAFVLLVSCLPKGPEPIDFPFFADYELKDVVLDDNWEAPIASVNEINLREISGAAQALEHDQCTWMIMDSGDSAHLYLFHHARGKHLATLRITGIQHVDWEDMATVEDSLGVRWIYIADIGDNAIARQHVTLYAFQEPALTAIDTNDASAIQNWQPAMLRTWEFVYQGGALDAESFMVDPATMKPLIWSKSSSLNSVYELPSIPSASLDTAVLKGIFPMKSTTGADCVRLADGSMPIILRNYQTAWIWPRDPGEPIYQALIKRPMKLPYALNELQGEAIWWQGSSWSTISESPLGFPVKIWTYQPK